MATLSRNPLRPGPVLVGDAAKQAGQLKSQGLTNEEISNKLKAQQAAQRARDASDRQFNTSVAPVDSSLIPRESDLGELIARMPRTGGFNSGFDLGSREAEAIAISRLANEFPTADPRTEALRARGDAAGAQINADAFGQLQDTLGGIGGNLARTQLGTDASRQQTLDALTRAVHDPHSASRLFANPALRELAAQTGQTRGQLGGVLQQLGGIASGQDSLAARTAQIEADRIARESASDLRSVGGRFNPAIARSQAIAKNQALADLGSRSAVAAEQERRGALGQLAQGIGQQAGQDIAGAQAVGGLARQLTADERNALAALSGVQIQGAQQDIGTAQSQAGILGQAGGFQQAQNAANLGLFGLGDAARARDQNMFLNALGLSQIAPSSGVGEIIGSLAGTALGGGLGFLAGGPPGAAAGAQTGNQVGQQAAKPFG